MKFLKVVFAFLLIVNLTSCLNDDPGIEQYYDNRDAGIAFLENNLERDEVQETESGSGLQYEVLEEGSGDKTLEFDTVKFKYSIKSIDGTVYTSNIDDDIEDISYAQVNLFFEPFVSEALELMNVGSRYTFYVPYQLAYGQYSSGDILPFSALIFEVELLENFFVENALKEGVFVTESGLQYEIMKEGTEDTKPTATSNVKVDYHGTFLNGTVFDSSVDRKTPSEFGVSQVIEGWTEGLQLMDTGAKYKFYIPYYLAYGASGYSTIPGYTPLVFEVELLEILD